MSDKEALLENEKKYLENESKHWREFCYRLRAESRKWVNHFCFNCGQDLRKKDMPNLKPLTRKENDMAEDEGKISNCLEEIKSLHRHIKRLKYELKLEKYGSASIGAACSGCDLNL